MKKLLALLLVAVMIFTLAACGGETTETPDGGSSQTGGETNSGTEGGSGSDGGSNGSSDVGGSNGGGSSTGGAISAGYAAERKLDKTGAVSTVDKLANTYYKLNTEKKLKIGYIGGSVTGGTGGTNGYCWASATTEWFKSTFPNAAIDAKNVAWGGTSSFWGYFRMDTDNSGRDNLIKFAPDIVFVEFSVNDGYAHLTRMQSTYYMEGIVKKLRAANPKVDIVFVFVTNSSKLGKDDDFISAHKDVAAHYGIPTVNVGKALIDEMNRTGNTWEYYVTDSVHPNNTGYKVYADFLAADLKAKLITSPDKSGLKDHAKPAHDLVSNSGVTSQLIAADSIANQTAFTAIDSKAVNCPDLGGKHMFGKQGAKMTVEFEGRGFGFLCDGGTGGKVKVTVGGKSVTVDVMGGNNFEYPAIENLNYGKHTAEIEIVAGSKIALGAFVVEK